MTGEKQTNYDYLVGTCKRIINTFEPDYDAAICELREAGIDPNDFDRVLDKDMLKCAIVLAQSYCEQSRSEGGVWISIDRSKVERNIKRLCDKVGVKLAELFPSADKGKVIRDGSNLW